MNAQSLAITQRDIDLYAKLTEDANPIHTDPAFARTTPMGGTIAHGTMSVGLLWNAIEDVVTGNISPIKLRLRFTAPVRPGDTVVAGGELPDASKGSHVWVRNQRGEAVIEGKLELPGGWQA